MRLNRNNYRLPLGPDTVALLGLVGVLILVACSDSAEGSESTQSSVLAATASVPETARPAPIGASAALNVATTMNIIADWVKNVGGDRVEVFSILPLGADPHSYQPGARDVARVANADLVFAVGLSMEASWLEELIHNASADASKIVELGEIADPIKVGEIEHERDEQSEEAGGHADEDEGNRAYGELDPHFWFDPLRAKRAVSDIAARLSALDPAGADTYGANAHAYNQQLDQLDAWIRAKVDSVPVGRRLLVTSHDSFRYFAERYGFVVVGTVIPGVTTEREPSAQEMAELVDKIRDSKVPVVFVENTVSDRLARRIADEAGVRIERELSTGSFGGSGMGSDTYIAMIKKNVETIVEALR